MTASISSSPLYAIANPKSIAFFGASNSFSSMGTSILRSILNAGFPGSIYPVHPKEKQVLHLTAYGHVSEIPEPADMAFIVLPTGIVTQTLQACGEAGIRHAVIVSAGFTEVGGEGVRLQKELVEIAHRYGIRFTGPNCIGVANSHANLNATFLPFEGKPGFIGMASQSGSFVTQMFSYLNQRFGKGFSTAFSLGNEADIDLVDCIEYLGACPDTKVIALYVESIRRGQKFIEIARKVSSLKPIVAFYVGGSETGKRACLSHTGSLAGPDRLYDGVFRQSGVIRARSIEEMFDFCYVLGSSPMPEGNRVIIQTHSGGPGAAAADACGRSGLELPALSPDTLEKIAPYVPHTASVNNPVDLTFTKNPLDFFHSIPKILLEEKNADGMLVYFLASARMVSQALSGMGVSEDAIQDQTAQIVGAQCRSVATLMETYQKPVIGFSFMTRENHFVAGLQDRGIPVLPSPERAAGAFGAMVQYTKLHRKIRQSANA
ncbi:MAG: CoA-binding protein [Pseudomonadota bacterium]